MRRPAAKVRTAAKAHPATRSAAVFLFKVNA
jgi:hypothetical protein